MEYINFDAEVRPGGPEGYLVNVRSEFGETPEPVLATFPFTDAVLESHLLKLENAILKSVGRRRKVRSAEEQSVQTLGQALFEFLLAGDALSLYRECQREAQRTSQGVRLRLRLGEAPELAGLPWEFLYDPRRKDYLSLDPFTPVLRYLDLAFTSGPLIVQPPLRILGMVASPNDLEPLDVEKEKARVEAALASLQAKGLVELTWLDGEGWEELQAAMRGGPWHIFHFIGHGQFDRVRDEGTLVFADRQGRAHPISATQLNRVLARQKFSLRLVVINACEGARAGQKDITSSVAMTLAQGGIPAVLAMQYEITDSGAVAFAESFYKALADGLSIDSAVADARNAINLRNESSWEWGIPVLVMRTADGRLFDMQADTDQTSSQKSGREEVPGEEDAVSVQPTPTDIPKSEPEEQDISPPEQTAPSGRSDGPISFNQLLMGNNKLTHSYVLDDQSPMNRTMNKIELRPTIVVGVGGTGAWILTWLKSMLLDQVGEGFSDIVQLIAFDTDSKLPEVRREDGSIVKLNTLSEFRNIGYVPVPAVLKNLHRFPEIKAWLPPNLPLQTIVQGARMTRLLGRMSIFYHFRDIRAVIDSAVRKIKRLDLAEIYADDPDTAIRFVDSPGINVFIISSLCGGTGAGTFIDITYLVRHFCQGNADHVFVNGYLALPSAFPNVRSQSRLEANAIGCLLDLDYLNQAGRFVEQYPHNEHVNLLARPFNICYLIEAKNRIGKTLSGMEDIAPMVANSIFLQIASQVGPSILSRWDNIEVVTEDDDEGRPTAYSGVGSAKFVFPSTDIIEACARRFCSDFIEQRLLHAQPTIEAIDNLVTGFAGEQRINRDNLLTYLLQGKGRQRQVDVGVTTQVLNNARIDEIADMARRSIRACEKLLEEEHQRQMLENRRELAATLLEGLQGCMENLVYDPQQGLNAAIQFAEQFVIAMGDLGRQMSEERDWVQSLLNSDAQRSQDAFTALTQATANRLPIMRNLQIRSTATAYMQASNQMLHNRLSRIQYDLALSILNDLREDAGQRRGIYVTLRDNLAQIQHSLQTQEGTRLDIDSEIDILTWPVVNRQDVAEFYTRFVPDPSQWMTLVVQACGPLSSWQSKEQNSLRGVLMDFARGAFAPIRDVNIEKYLFKESGREATDAWIEHARNLSVPFWRWIRGRGFASNDPEEISVFGVPNQKDSIFKDFRYPGEELISTNDRQSLFMLRTEHGLSATALEDYPKYERSYEQYYDTSLTGRSSKISLRLFDPAFRPQKMGEPPHAIKAFAIGLVFGSIAEQENGVFYYRRPDHQLQGEWIYTERLSADMRHAAEQLGSYGNFMEEIEIAANRYRERFGMSGIRERAQEYLLNAPERSDDLQEFQRLLSETIKAWAEIE